MIGKGRSANVWQGETISCFSNTELSHEIGVETLKNVVIEAVLLEMGPVLVRFSRETEPTGHI